MVLMSTNSLPWHLNVSFHCKVEFIITPWILTYSSLSLLKIQFMLYYTSDLRCQFILILIIHTYIHTYSDICGQAWLRFNKIKQQQETYNPTLTLILMTNCNFIWTSALWPYSSKAEWWLASSACSEKEQTTRVIFKF